MKDTYSGGYFKALLDLQKFIDRIETEDYLKRGLRRYKALKSLIEYLLLNPGSRETFRDFGGTVFFKTESDGTVILITSDKNELKTN